MNWRKSESTVYPELVDLTQSKTTAYVRKDIEEEVRENQDGTSTTWYVYQEIAIDKDIYYASIASISDKIADIENALCDLSEEG